LTSVALPNSITNIGSRAFTYCTSLTSATIGDGVTSIGDQAFQYCTNLISITIPYGVTNIGFGAFSICYSLTGVYFKGNAPSVDPAEFWPNNQATVYYLPGTTGWGTTFGGRPTALWIQPLQASGVGVQAKQFGFTITGPSGLIIVVETCTDLANSAWSPLLTNTLSGDAFYFSDPQWTNYPRRFYRVRSP
jgi:hypothetical protein